MKKSGFTLQNFSKKNLGGFTAIEAIIAIFVLTVAVIGVYSSFSRMAISTSILSSRLVASYLAKEGIEIVRNIRDTNWLQARELSKTSPWDDGLICLTPSCYWQADYTTQTFTETADFEKCSDPEYNCHSYDETPLKFDGGFYNYSLGTETKFKRKITITSESDGSLKVFALVEWQEKGEPYSFEAEEYLYDWY